MYSRTTYIVVAYVVLVIQPSWCSYRAYCFIGCCAADSTSMSRAKLGCVSYGHVWVVKERGLEDFPTVGKSAALLRFSGRTATETPLL